MFQLIPSGTPLKSHHLPTVLWIYSFNETKVAVLVYSTAHARNFVKNPNLENVEGS